MIITPRQLKLIHYYYFAMGIFGLANAFFIGIGSPFSIIFLAFYVFNSAISWYIAHVARRKMSGYIVVQSIGFFIWHILLSVITVGMTTLVWMSGIIPEVGLLTAMMMANYFVLFMAGLWYLFTRTDFVSGLFTVYDTYLFKKSKEFMLRIKRKYRGFFGRDIVTDDEIRNYEYGTIQEVDDNLISAWKNKSKLQYVLECLGRIELSLARHVLQYLREELSSLRSSNDPDSIRLARRAEKEIADRSKDIAQFERNFYKKTGESEFISL